MKIAKHYIRLALLVLVLPSNISAASFDCSYASSPTEKAICNNQHLSRLDDLMGIIWADQQRSNEERNLQRVWLSKRDECLDDVNCIENQYLEQLKNRFHLHNFEIMTVSGKNGEKAQVLLTQQFYLYNIEYHAYKITNASLQKLRWIDVEFNEEISTCGLSETDTSTIVNTKVSNSVIGVIGDATEKTKSTRSEIKLFTRWVGHGDFSNEVTYILEGDVFVIDGLTLDNCEDQAIRHVPVNIGDEFAGFSEGLIGRDNSIFYAWMAKKLKSDHDLNTNQLVWSDEFSQFLDTNLISKKSYYLGQSRKNIKLSLRETLGILLGGPPDPVQIDVHGNYFISGCRFRSCSEKGFVWIDPSADKIIFGMLVYFFDSEEHIPDGLITLFSRDFDLITEVPSQFITALDEWKQRERVDARDVIFLD